MSIVLSFREEGASYDRAKAVADALGIPIHDYLLSCIAEGHKVLRARHRPSEADLDTPTFERWGVPLEYFDPAELEARKQAERDEINRLRKEQPGSEVLKNWHPFSLLDLNNATVSMKPVKVKLP